MNALIHHNLEKSTSTARSCIERTGRRGFTMIELLAVIGIIAILAAILIPTVSKVRQSANDNRTRAQFSQWITAIENFKQEYGYWPDFRMAPGTWQSMGTENENFVIRLNESDDIRRNFVEFLTGRRMDGSSFREGGFQYEGHPNRRGIEFYRFSENDYDVLTEGDGFTAGNVRFVDAYRNTDIVIVMDANNDGQLTLTSANDNYGVRSGFDTEAEGPRVSPVASGERTIRAGVAIYSAGRASSNQNEARENIVTSW